MTDKLNEDIRKLMSSFGKANILEIGCGTGSNIERFYDNAKNYFAIEQDIDLFIETRRNMQGKSNVFLTMGNAVRTSKNQYDFVIINEDRPETARQALAVVLDRNLRDDYFMVVFNNYPKVSYFVDEYLKEEMILIGENAESAAVCITPEKKKMLENTFSKEAI